MASQKIDKTTSGNTGAAKSAPSSTTASMSAEASHTKQAAGMQPGALLQLQSKIGNRGVTQLLRSQAGAGSSHAAQRKTNRTGMPDQLKSGVENLSGLAMDDVKVHYNSAKPSEVNALAYAQGSDIHLGPGQEKHLPHEAWHIAQQKQGRVKPTVQMKGASINDDAGLEHEADVMGAKAMSEHRDK
ncbi:eCIS core domain-containing protein [Paenibacillus sp. LPE1-1-1.1]|uniref:eCIS core domain-containing protein n=1 Tax=Paenibacillus sp. LPE1-1-1.1 TaxID=3135230 RepID=UPI00343EF52E